MRIYLASPYSHPDPAVRQQRHDLACEAAALLMLAGHQVFSPIAHSHAVGAYMAEAQVLDFSFWMTQDLPYISHWADIVAVLTLPGHAESRGVQREITWASTEFVPVVEGGTAEQILEDLIGIDIELGAQP